MDGIGAEVWQKIRSAIKAKLTELDAYVDEQLPEYIMVMVGNKRSKGQMEEDLKLFLGSNSVHFTNWLHQVLQKLQEVTVPNLDIKKSSASTSVKRKSSDEIPKKKKKTKKSIDVSEKKNVKKAKDISSVVDYKCKEEYSITDKDVNIRSEVINNNSSDQENVDSHALKFEQEKGMQKSVEELTVIVCENNEEILEKETGVVKNIGTKTKKEKSPSIIDEGEEEDFLNIKADMEGDLMDGDTDMYEEEPVQKELSKTPIPRKRNSSDSESEKLVSKRRPSSRSSSVTRHDKNFDARHLLNRKTDARELLNRKAAARLSAHDDKRKLVKREREHSPVRKHYENDRSYDRHSSRRVIVSTRDTSKSRKYDEDKDKSSIERSYSSSVVVKRKDSEVIDKKSGGEKASDRPKKWQESSSTEGVKKAKIISISQTLKEEVIPRVRSHEAEESKKRSGVLSRVVSRQHEPEDSIETPIPSVIKVTPRPRRPLSQQANHTLIFKALADAKKSMASSLRRPDAQQQKCPRLEEGVFTRTLREKNRIPPSKIAVCITNNRLVAEDKNSNNSKEDVEEEGTQQEKEAMNNRAVPELLESLSENGSVASKVNSSISDPDAEEMANMENTNMIADWLKGVNEASSCQDVPDESENRDTEMNNTLFTKSENGPQFVVTLNGLDPTMFFNGDDNDELEEWDKQKETQCLEEEPMEGQVLTEHQLMIQKRPTSPIIIVKKTANNNNLVDVMEATKAKPIERCKYWPNCRTGDQCIYHHPITPCKTFPTCKFGEHCLFIHPQCRFNTACTRRGCPYSHTSTTIVPSAVTKSTQACRFFPKCTNMSCPFYHPKTCRFGAYCTKKDCTFSHTEIATVDKLKWSREGTT